MSGRSRCWCATGDGEVGFGLWSDIGTVEGASVGTVEGADMGTEGGRGTMAAMRNASASSRAVFV